MAKHNKYNIGDIVGHKETPTLKFRVIDVCEGVPEKEGSYGYAYSQFFEEDDDNMDSLFMTLDNGLYMEKDLFLIRKPTYQELACIIVEALNQVERFEGIVSEARIEINKLKNDT